MSLTRKLNSAMNVFKKAKCNLEDVIKRCDKQDAKSDNDERVARSIFDDVMAYVNSSRAESKTVRDQATKSIEQINKIIGE